MKYKAGKLTLTSGGLNLANSNGSILSALPSGNLSVYGIHGYSGSVDGYTLSDLQSGFNIIADASVSQIYSCLVSKPFENPTISGDVITCSFTHTLNTRLNGAVFYHKILLGFATDNEGIKSSVNHYGFTIGFNLYNSNSLYLVSNTLEPDVVIGDANTSINISCRFTISTNTLELFVDGVEVYNGIYEQRQPFDPSEFSNAGIYTFCASSDVNAYMDISISNFKVGDSFDSTPSAQEISPDFDIGYISIYPKVDCKLSLKMDNSYGDDIFLPANSSFSDTIHANKIKLDTISDDGDVYYYLRK